MPAAAIAIPAALSAGASIFGAVKGSRAARQAGQMQSEAALGEAQRFRDVLAQYNPQIGEAVSAGQAGVGSAMDEYRRQTLGANELLAPYTGAGTEALGTLREFMAPGGAGNRTFTAADMEAYDPGYQFRIDEAKKAYQTSAAAHGGVLGGGTLRALNQRVQDVASSEFGAAHDRFRQQQQDRFSRLSTLMGTGLNAAGAAGGNLMQLGQAGLGASQWGGELGLRGVGLQASNALSTQQQISDLMTGGAAARAAGTVGSANAWGQGLAGVAGAVGQAGAGYMQYQQGKEYNDTLRDWMKAGNPALTPPPNYGLGPAMPSAPWQIPSPAQMPWYLRGTDYGYSPAGPNYSVRR